MSVSTSPFADEFREDPFPRYRALRERAPVCWADDPGGFLVARHADVVEVLRRPDAFSSDAMGTQMMGVDVRAAAGPEGDPEALRNLVALAQALPFDAADLQRRPGLINADPPRHDELRRIVNRGFSPRRVAAWEPRIRELVAECVAPLRRGDDFDVVRDLAVPVPVIVISELLGVEPERREDFKRWSDGIVAGTSGSRRHLGFAESGVTERIGEFARYFAEVAERRRRDPKDDLISVLLDAEAGEGALCASELVMFALLLLVAGNETTTNLIGNAVNALLDHPAQLARVRAEPGLVPDLVEETVRWNGPVQLLFRRATRDVGLGGTTIPEGSLVIPLLGSANRDERQWGPTAERFDVTRDTRGHLGFGFGVHFCLGASLARLEARCALEALVPELGDRRRRSERVEWVDSYLVRGPRRLELVPA